MAKNTTKITRTQQQFLALVNAQLTTRIGRSEPVATGASRGFVALNKLDKAALLSLVSTLDNNGNGYRRQTNNSSAVCMYAAHALPVTHIEAQAIANKMFDAIGLMRSEFSNGAIWHSNPNGIARTLRGGKSGYTSDAAQQRGGFTLQCATHDMRANRALCLRECLQVIVQTDGKSLYTLATKRKFNLNPTKRTATPKPAPKPATPNPTTNNGETPA